MGFFTKDEFNKKYTPGKTLGTGSFAEVKLCILKKDPTVVRAAKIIDKAKCKTEDVEALELEIELMQSIDHPNVVKLHETFHCAKKVYLVMDIMSGGELFDRIVEKEKYDEVMGRESVYAIASALDYCHERNIVHRDLKPENLLYESDKEDAALKLADFGLAKIVSSENLLKTACGTPGYVAPEILKQQPYDEKVDVWSLGVIMYIILCGFPPFYDENNSKLFKAIKAGAYDFPAPYWDDVSQDAKDLIKAMLTVDPAKRISIKQVLAHKWLADLGNADAPNANLALSKEALRKYNVKRKFKAVLDVARMAAALKALTAD